MDEQGLDAGSEAPPNTIFEIKVRGYLPEYRAGWFGGLRVIHDGAGNTVLRGPIADQAALHGLIERIRDLGIPLISLARVEP